MRSKSPLFTRQKDLFIITPGIFYSYGLCRICRSFHAKRKKRSTTNIFPKKPQKPPKNPLYPGRDYSGPLQDWLSSDELTFQVGHSLLMEGRWSYEELIFIYELSELSMESLYSPVSKLQDSSFGSLKYSLCIVINLDKWIYVYRCIGNPRYFCSLIFSRGQIRPGSHSGETYYHWLTHIFRWIILITDMSRVLLYYSVQTRSSTDLL